MSVRKQALEEDQLIKAGFLSRSFIVGSAPYIESLVPAARWDHWVREGLVPKPIKLGKWSVWRREDVLKLVMQYRDADLRQDLDAKFTTRVA